MKKEQRVYIIDLDLTNFDFRSHEQVGDYKAIMEEAEKIGMVFSLPFFVECINNEDLNLLNSFIYIN
jgi:hypothetical protein